MKALIAGTGSIGKRHIVNIQYLEPDANFIFVRENAREDEYSLSMQANVVSDIEEALKLKPDVFVIATPSSLHCEYILAGIQANVPMYIEKPLVIHKEDIELIKYALKHNRYTAPSLAGCNLRYLHSLKILKDAISQGKVGNIARASFQVGQWLPDWRPGQDYKKSYSAKRSMGGGVVFDLIHEIDAARWLLGEFENVKAMIADHAPLDIDSESVACIVMGKRSGTPVVTVCLDYIARKLIRKYEIIGDKGTLVWDLSDKSLKLENQNGVEKLTENEAHFDVSQTYVDAMKELLYSINNHTKTTQGISEGILTSELAVHIKGNA